MIAVSSPSLDKDAAIKATIREMMNDGSKTFTVKAIRREMEKHGLHLTSQAINQSLRSQPGLSEHGNMPRYWTVEGDLLGIPPKKLLTGRSSLK